MVGSVLNYSAEVWGNNEAKDIEILHTKFCRWILQVRKSTNLSGLYGELGRFPLIVYRKISMIRYWIRILSSSNTFISKIIYNMLHKMAPTGLFKLKTFWTILDLATFGFSKMI